MTTYFFDSSALAKRYHREEGSKRVAAIFDEPDRRIVISHLRVLEMRSMFAGKVRAGALNPTEANELAERFIAGIGSESIEVFEATDLQSALRVRFEAPAAL